LFIKVWYRDFGFIMTFDYIIAGAGLAGSLLAWHLHRLGAKVLLTDVPNPAAASRVAAGIVNPITGRHMVKAHHVDTVLAYDREFYTEFERETGTPVFLPRPILRVFRSTEEQQLWEQRLTRPDYVTSMKPALPSSAIAPGIIAPYGGGEITGGGWIQISSLLNTIYTSLPHTELALGTPAQTSELTFSSTGVQWREHSARRFIFCEGWRSARNPLFLFIPFFPSYGEIVVFRAPTLDSTYILNSGVHIVPLGDGLFRAGATNKWDIFEEAPSEAGKTELIEKIGELLTCPFEIVAQAAGIRPSILDRRPVAGLHPDMPAVGILNGFCGKGVFFGPWAAYHFAQFLEGKQALPEDIDIARFPVTQKQATAVVKK
jgi:glycine oxidase